jgi:hypothetical protein
MGEQHQAAADFVADRAGFTTDPVQNLRTGLFFRAEIDGSPDALLVASELGEDYRNVILLHVNDDNDAAGIHDQDKVKFTLFGRISTATIIKRRDNPANPQIEFWAMQLTGLDT